MSPRPGLKPPDTLAVALKKSVDLVLAFPKGLDSFPEFPLSASPILPCTTDNAFRRSSLPLNRLAKSDNAIAGRFKLIERGVGFTLLIEDITGFISRPSKIEINVNVDGAHQLQFLKAFAR